MNQTNNDGDRIEEWKTARSVLKEFDDRIDGLRKYGFTVVTTLLTLSGFLLNASIAPSPTGGTQSLSDAVKVSIVGVIMLLVVALRFLERNYQLFNQATAIRARILERSLNFELTDKISDWYKRRKMWQANFVYSLFAFAAFVLGYVAVSPSSSINIDAIVFKTSVTSREMLGIFLSSVIAALLVMEAYLRLTLPKRTVDWSIDRLQCKAGENVKITLTNFGKDEPFKPGSTILHIESENGPVVEPDIKWPATPLKSWGERRYWQEWRRTRAVRQYPAWKPDVDKLTWLREMESHTWEWDTTDVSPGTYQVVPHARPYKSQKEDPIPQPPLPVKIVVSRNDDLKFAAIQQVAAGRSDVIGPVVGKKIRVIAYSITLAATGALKFQDSGGGDLTGSMSYGTTPITYPGDRQAPAMETAKGMGLAIVSINGAANGHLTYSLL